jgi:O-antigen biosynthesis protein
VQHTTTAAANHRRGLALPNMVREYINLGCRQVLLFSFVPTLAPMSKVALVTHDVQTLAGRAGGVAAFVTHWARLLRQAGEEVTIVLTRQETHPVAIDEKWRSRYAEWGIKLVELHNTEPSPDRWSEPWTARLSELVAPHLNGFDIAYFQDWANVAFHTARVKRFARPPMPVLVTVLHGPSPWIRTGNQAYPEVPEDLHLDYIERYSAKYSDFVVSPSRYMVAWLRANGWEFRADPAVLGLPYLAQERAVFAIPKAPVARLIFFGRLEIRKGFSLFVSALRLLFDHHPSALEGIFEIVLLGESPEPATLHGVRAELAPLAIPVVHRGDLDSGQAQEFLAGCAVDSLVIVPSPADNFPYAVIEASRIPGVNLLCSQGGGIPEIFDGHAKEHFFEPHPLALAGKLRERLMPSASVPVPNLPPYDSAAANARWLSFHRHALETPARPVTHNSIPSVDVCIPYFNKAAYLPQLLTALERQTAKRFGVIVVDDGSDPAAKAVFDQLAEKYRDRGWTFVAQPNSFVDAARNRAASLSTATYLFFIDADDVPVPHAIERMLEAITLSGDDCVVAGGMLVEHEAALDPENARVLARYMPLGPDLVCGLVDPMVLGPSMILIRRGAFEQIGGYRTVRGAAHEDWELQIRLVMAGLRVDVLPEFLLYFRKTESGLSRTSSEYEAKRRLIETYEDELARVGLRGMAATLIALLKRREELEKAVKENEEARARRLHGLVGEMLRRRAKGS